MTDTTPEAAAAEEPLYLYIDLETPGLEPKLGILEVGWKLTKDLASFGGNDAPVFAMLASVNVELAYESAAPFVREMHTKNGLWEELKDHDQVVPLFVIEQEILRQVGNHQGPLYLVGNGIRMDRAFIEKWMPALDQRLHYRQIDLTSVWLFLQGVGLDIPKASSEGTHRVIDDVRNSILNAIRLGKEVKERAKASFLNGPAGGREILLKRQPKKLDLGGWRYVRIDDPDTGESLGAYAYAPVQ